MVLSVALSLPFLFIGEYWMALTCLLFGIFIDIDHQLDFYLLFGRFTWSITELSEELLEHNKPTFFCPLHSWEFIILLVLLSCRFDMFIGATVSVTIHLITDIMFNYREKQDLLKFSCLYRAKGELKLYKQFRQDYQQQLKETVK